MVNLKTTLSLVALALSATFIYAQDFTADQYKKAAWMATRFYGAQRSGQGPNWLSVDETRNVSFVKDNVGGKDVSGGWFDCGDHVMFGQTQYYSIYALLKAYESFPNGYYDFYTGDYSDYKAKNKFGWGDGTPNGIPDLIEELKYALDFVLKATGPNFFVYQKGDGNYDHQQWVTPAIMTIRKITEGGESDGSRPILKNPSGGAMASMASAALALGSKLMRPYYGDTYADQLATNAKYAYDYAKSQKGTVGAPGNFYPSNALYDDNIAIAAAEMYRLTGESAYLTLAEDKAWFLNQHGYSLNYNNENDLAVYVTGQAAEDTDYYDKLNNDYVKKYTSQTNGEGVATNGGAWGALRFPVNQAFVAGLYAKATNDDVYDSFIYNQVDYILGANIAKQSFVVGFCEGCNNSPQHPHHRGVFNNNTNPANKQAMTIPNDHKEFGALVGGSLTSGSYVDDIEQYKLTEVCTDYNVGLVASLGYILSKAAPTNVHSVVKKNADFNMNWAGSTLQLQTDSGQWSLMIFDVKGEVKYSQTKDSKSPFEFTPHQPGVYRGILSKGSELQQFNFISN